MPKYLVALAVGGLMECPEITYQDYQEIEAVNEKQACEIYNKKNNCEFFYGQVIRKINDDETTSDIDKFKNFFDEIGIKYKDNGNCLYLDEFATRGGQLMVVDFYEDNKFQCFSLYPDSQACIYNKEKQDDSIIFKCEECGCEFTKALRETKTIISPPKVIHHCACPKCYKEVFKEELSKRYKDNYYE